MAESSHNKKSSIQIGEFQDALLQVNFADPAQKQDKEFGRKLVARIYKEQNTQSSTFYFGGRNIRWQENWEWFMGRQNMNEFTDYVSTEGNKAYSPVDMTPNRIAPQFMGVLIDSMSQNEEYPCVTAIDDGSITEKNKRKIDALFRMREIETIRELQQQSGVQLEPTNAYVPDDELSAEVYFKLEDRLPKEILFQEMLSKTMKDNQYHQKARHTKRDLIALNCAVTKIEKTDNGFIAIRKCTPANMIYNFFMNDSGQMELSYIGEVFSLKIKDLRRKYGKSDKNTNGLSEQDIFVLAKTATQFNNANQFIYYWNESYMYATDRPYDDYNIQVFDCEIQTFDADYYVNKKDNFGKENIQLKKNIPEPTSEKATVIKKDKLTWYRGIWAIKADKMIYWGLPDLVIRPYMNIAESLSSYTIQVPNNDGRYVPSLFERGLSPLRKWTIADLKLKQLIANIRPTGITIDIEQIRDIDLGDGKVIPPLEVVKIYNQTGNVIWSSRGLDPLQRQEVPIREMPNAGSVAQLSELVNVKNDSMQELRSVWGVPLYRDGSDLPPRMGAAVIENQTTNSNNVTDFINFSDKCLWEETLHKVCIMHWDEMVLRQNKTEWMDTVFEVSIELKPTAYEKQMLENNIQIGMKSIDQSTGKPLLSFKDAFKIRNIQDYKLAELYLANVTERNEKVARQKQKEDQESNMQSQQQTAQQSAQAQQQMQEKELEMKEKMADEALRRQKELALLNGIMGIYDSAIKAGTGIPDELKPLVSQVISNVSMPLVEENKDMQQEIQMQQNQQLAHQYAQQQQMQSQQQIPQQSQSQNPQEETDEEQQQPQSQQ